MGTSRVWAVAMPALQVCLGYSPGATRRINFGSRLPAVPLAD